MKQKLLLVLFGSVCGALLSGVTYLLFPALYTTAALSSGQKFDSIDDLRKSMVATTSQDRRSDGSVSLRTIVQPNLSDRIIYELKPNITERFEHVMITTNSFGLRSPEILVKKPTDTYRVAVLGDSYAFGWGVEQDRPFSRVMEAELNRNQNGRRFEVLNFGVPGYATFQEVAQFLEKGAQFAPDAVVVYVISNDFHLPFFIRDLNGNDPSALVTSPTFHNTTVDPQDAEKLAKRQDLLKALDANRALVELGRYCREEGIRLFVVVHPDSAEQKTRQRLWALSNKENRALMTSWKISKEYQELVAKGIVPEESLKLPRDHHPGPGAHRLIGMILAQKLQNALDAPAPTEKHPAKARRHPAQVNGSLQRTGF